MNAALNMLRIFNYAQSNGGERHFAFSRSVPTSKKQKQQEAKKQSKVKAKAVARAKRALPEMSSPPTADEEEKPSKRIRKCAAQDDETGAAQKSCSRSETSAEVMLLDQ